LVVVVLGFELGLMLVRQVLHPPFLVMGVFKIGSHELFAWTGFEQ
jgi:hypothetical protein